MARRRKKKAGPSVQYMREHARRVLGLLLVWLWSTLCLFRHLNPVRLVRTLSTNTGWSSTAHFAVDAEGTVVYSPTLWERISKALHTDAQQRGQLVDWAQQMLPKQRVTNLNSCWADGIVLCALVEAICPGACPRYDLLKPYHKVNNCRLGLKLASKNLGIPQTIISPEEMVDSKGSNDVKVKQLLSLMKWAHAQTARRGSAANRGHLRHQPLSLDERMTCHSALQCIVRGSGLFVGLVGNRSKFDVLTPANEALDIDVEILGPRGEKHHEHITSMFRRRDSVALVDHITTSQWSTLMDPKVLEDLKKIPFDYTSIAEGHIQCYYTPQSEGKYTVIVRWQGVSIRGSPFTVTVANNIEKLNNMKSNGLVVAKNVSLDARTELDDEGLKECPTETKLDSDMNTVKAAVLSRSSKVHRSMSKFGVQMDDIPKQATITRRRVLKRVMTTADQEIVIQMAPPTPEQSRQSSLDLHEVDESLDIFNEDGKEAKSEESSNPEKDNHLAITTVQSPERQKLKKTKRSFDCEFIYDSDASGLNTCESRPRTPTKLSGDRSSKFPTDDDSLNHSFFSDSRVSRRYSIQSSERCQKPPLIKLSKSASTPSFGMSTATLGVPTCDVKFQCSPYNVKREVLKPTMTSSQEQDVIPFKRTSSSLYEYQMPSTESSITSALETDSDSARAPLSAHIRVRTQMKGSNMRVVRESSQSLGSNETDSTKTNEPEGCSQFEIDHSLAYLAKDNINRKSDGHLSSFVGLVKHSEHVSDTQDSSDMTLKTLRSEILRKSSVFVTQGKCGDEWLSEDELTKLNDDERLDGDSLPASAKRLSQLGCVSLSETLQQIEAMDDSRHKHAVIHSQRKQHAFETDHEDHINPPVSTSDKSNVTSLSNCESGTVFSESEPLDRTVSAFSDAAQSHELPLLVENDNGFGGTRSVKPKHASNYPNTLMVPKVMSPVCEKSGTLRAPKAKMDKWSQVSYEEIKSETGWTRPSQYVKPRRKLQKKANVDQTDHRQTFIQVKNKLNVGSVSRESRSLCSNIGAPHAPNQGNPLPQNTQRQSTIDSGIADDNTSSSNRVQSPYTQRIVHGHRPVRRQHCRGNIPPSFKLKQSLESSGDEDNQVEMPSTHHRLNQDWSKTNPLPAGDTVDKFPKSKRLQGHHALRHKRRVTFSRRVMLYKRSSTRSKSGSREESQHTYGFKGSRPIKARIKRNVFSKKWWHSQHRCSRGTSSIDTPTPPPTIYAEDLDPHQYSESDLNMPPLQLDHFQLGIDLNVPHHGDLSGGSSGVASDMSNTHSGAVNPVSLSPNSFYENTKLDGVDHHQTLCSPVDITSGRHDSRCDLVTTLGNSLESLDGFGVSSATRKKLLEEVDLFSRITDGDTRSESVNSTHGKGKNHSVNEQQGQLDADVDASSEASMELAQFMTSSHSSGNQGPNSHTSPVEAAMDHILKLYEDFPGIDTDIDKENAPLSVVEVERPMSQEHCLADAATASDVNLFSDVQTDVNASYYPLNASTSVPDPFCCRAYGTGLRFGHVNTKNNFQVVTKTVGNGSLNVTITGPRAHTVAETSVVFTGDDVYEVFYQVDQPGHYIITVRWSDYNIPESPFICKVTY